MQRHRVAAVLATVASTGVWGRLSVGDVSAVGIISEWAAEGGQLVVAQVALLRCSAGTKAGPVFG